MSHMFADFIMLEHVPIAHSSATEKKKKFCFVEIFLFELIKLIFNQM